MDYLIETAARKAISKLFLITIMLFCSGIGYGREFDQKGDSIVCNAIFAWGFHENDTVDLLFSDQVILKSAVLHTDDHSGTTGAWFKIVYRDKKYFFVSCQNNDPQLIDVDFAKAEFKLIFNRTIIRRCRFNWKEGAYIILWKEIDGVFKTSQQKDAPDFD